MIIKIVCAGGLAFNGADRNAKGAYEAFYQIYSIDHRT